MSDEESIEITLKEVEVQKLSLDPGDTLLVTVKHEDVDRESLNALQRGFAKNFPNNKIMVFALGNEGEIKLAVMKETVALAPNLGYCSDCSCGKKERVEGQNG